MILRFLLVNFLSAAVIAAAWQFGLLSWAADLPPSTWAMIGFLGAVWCAGVGFVVARNWAAVYHVSNLLPILGLVMTGLGFQIARHLAPADPMLAYTFMFHAILESLSTTFLSVALMAQIRELAFWVGAEHV